MKTVLASVVRPVLSRALSRDAIENADQSKPEAVWLTISSILFALCFGYKVLPHLSRVALASADWDTHMELRWVPFYTILHFHQLPLWNPYRCGGMPMLGHPQSAMASPFLLLDLLFGPMIGTHLAVVIHIAIAFSGACFLARAVGISRLGATAAGGCFAGSSWYYMHMAAGHADFLSYTYAPWAIAFFYLSVQRRRMTFAALSGLVVALMYLEGGVYEAPQTALMLILLAAALSLQGRSFYPLIVLAIVGVGAAGFAAVKFLPTLDFFGPAGRPIGAGEPNAPRLFLTELFSRNQYPGRPFEGQPWGFHEYGAYIGIIFGSLSLWGIARSFRRSLPWLVMSVATLSLAAGGFGLFSPWVVIHQFPLFSSERIPTRFLILFSLSAGVLAGLGTDALAEKSGRWGAPAARLLVGIALIDIWLVSASYLHDVVEGNQDPKPWSATFVQSSEPRMGGHAMYIASNANFGVIACNDAIPHSFSVRGFEDAGYRGEQYLLGAGSVALRRWTPNALGFEVNAPSPTVLVVNQNYDRNWRVVSGRGEVFSNDGLIAVRIPAGRQKLEIAFRSHAFMVGLSGTLLTALATLVVLWAERRAAG